MGGISADYYLRLEQGRDRDPSPPVLEALAGVFGSIRPRAVPAQPVRRRRGRRAAAPRSSAARHPAAARRARAAGLRREPHLRRARREQARHRIVAQASGPAEPTRSTFLDEDERDLSPSRSTRSAAWSPRSARPSAPTPGTRGSRSWSASCRWPASSSAGCGPGTTSGSGGRGRPDHHPQFGCLNYAGRSWRSADRAASYWSMYVPSRARTAPGRWRCSGRSTRQASTRPASPRQASPRQASNLL